MNTVERDRYKSYYLSLLTAAQNVAWSNCDSVISTRFMFKLSNIVVANNDSNTQSKKKAMPYSNTFDLNAIPGVQDINDAAAEKCSGGASSSFSSRLEELRRLARESSTGVVSNIVTSSSSTRPVRSDRSDLFSRFGRTDREPLAIISAPEGSSVEETSPRSVNVSRNFSSVSVGS